MGGRAKSRLVKPDRSCEEKDSQISLPFAGANAGTFSTVLLQLAQGVI